MISNNSKAAITIAIHVEEKNGFQSWPTRSKFLLKSDPFFAVSNQNFGQEPGSSDGGLTKSGVRVLIEGKNVHVHAQW